MIAFLYNERSVFWPCLDELRRLSGIDKFNNDKALLDELSVRPYSTLLIDYEVAHQNDFHFFKMLQKDSLYNGCPVVVVSQDDCEEKKLKALEAGASDFYSNKMRKQEMEFRLKNKVEGFKRSKNILQIGNVRIIPSDLKTYLSNKQIDLTLIEMKILILMIKAYPAIIPREAFVNDVWPGQIILPTTINTHLYNLRSKFKTWEYEILTLKSKGYCLKAKT